MSLHVTARGEGEPAVLLHRGGMSGRQWRKLGEALAPTHRVLTPDFLGSGEHPHGGAVNAELTRHILAATAPRSP